VNDSSAAGHAIEADRSGDGEGDAIIADRRGSGHGAAVAAYKYDDGTGVALFGHREGTGEGDALYARREADGRGAAIRGVGEVGLAIEGRAQFASVGEGSIASGAASATVPNVMVSIPSHISVTLLGDAGATLAWVERDPGTGFTIHLAGPATADTAFTYFIVDPI
jgi:hypothetical protein